MTYFVNLYRYDFSFLQNISETPKYCTNFVEGFNREIKL